MSDRVVNSGRVGGLVLVCAVLSLLAGCGKSDVVGTVEGKVALNGQPFSNARLNFLNEKTRAASAADIESNAGFKLATPMAVGTYIVFLTPKLIADPDHPNAGTGVDPSVPEKCWNEATSSIRVEIKEGKNETTIELGK